MNGNPLNTECSVDRIDTESRGLGHSYIMPAVGLCSKTASEHKGKRKTVTVTVWGFTNPGSAQSELTVQEPSLGW